MLSREQIERHQRYPERGEGTPIFHKLCETALALYNKIEKLEAMHIWPIRKVAALEAENEKLKHDLAVVKEDMLLLSEENARLREAEDRRQKEEATFLPEDISCKEYVGVLHSEVEALRAGNDRRKKAVLALTGENERLLREVKQLREDNKWVNETWHKEVKEWMDRYDELRAVVYAANELMSWDNNALEDVDPVTGKPFLNPACEEYKVAVRKVLAALKRLEGK